MLNILGGNVKEAVSVTLPHALILRSSTGPPRVRTSLTVARGRVRLRRRLVAVSSVTFWQFAGRLPGVTAKGSAGYCRS